MKPTVTSLVFLTFMSISVLAKAIENDKVINFNGKTYYTKVNIWYDNPEKISIDNYHRGAILPAGTRAIINKIDREIKFDADSGLAFNIVIRKKGPRGPKRKVPVMTYMDFFDRIFSEKNVMDKEGDFYKFTPDEQKNIKEGRIAKGMVREAVLMAYGYPPISLTPALLSDAWNYIGRSNRDKILVIFKDNKVVSIEESEISGGPPGTRREKLIKAEDKTE